MKFKTIFALLIIMLVGVAACTQQQQTQETVPSDNTGDSMEDTGTMEDGAMEDDSMMEDDSVMEDNNSMENDAMEESMEENVKEFTVEAKQWDFVPETITVQKGDTVRLLVTSTDVDHGLAIPEFGINENLPVGEEVTIEFTADKAGEYRMFCSVYCGSGHSGMTGTLIVEE